MIAPLLALALAHPTPLATPGQFSDVRLLQKTPDGWQAVPFRPRGAGAPHRRASALLPRTTRSEVVTRLAAFRRGARFRLEGADVDEIIDVSATWVTHANDEEVLEVGGPLRIVGPPVLPTRVTARGVDVQPFTARLDGNSIEAGLVRVGAPARVEEGAELRLLALGAPGAYRAVEHEPEDGTWSVALDAFHRVARDLGRYEPGDGAFALPAQDVRHSGTLDFSGGARLDRLFFATVRPIDAHARELELEGLPPLPAELAEGEALELGVRLPASQADVTGTLILSVLLDPFGRFDPSWPEGAAPESAFGGLQDVASELGLAFVHMEGPDEQLDIRPTMGPGAAWGDVDGDTWPDLYLVQGCGRMGSLPPQNRLFHNDGGDGFTDWTEQSGTGDPGCGMGALFFDGEGDGDLDLYVANYGADVLFENSGDGTFFRRGPEVGVAADGWSSAVCAADVDLDGDLDLYVTSYLDYDESKMPAPEDLQRYQREDPVAMLPFAFPGAANVFLENDFTPAEVTRGTQLHFRDRTQELKLADAQGRGMQAVFWDFDRDGDSDLYVANDVSFNVLFRNDREAGFRDISFATGMDDPRGGMGVAIGDVDRDGDGDLFLTNWQLETNALYTNNLVTQSARSRVGTFRDRTVPSGLGPAGIGVTSWGTTFFDAENDGDLDLFVANGYTSPDYESTGICVGQPDHFFENDGTGRFRLAAEEAGSALDVALASRCVAPCDFDRDGRVDLLVTANNGRARLLRNVSDGDGHWLGVHLRQAGPNPFAIGAEVTLVTPDGPLRASLFAGTSYLAGNPSELHLGLGAAEPEALEVRWPDGESTRHAVPELDRWITVRRP